MITAPSYIPYCSFFVQSPSHDIPTDCISSHDYNKGNFTALDYLTGPKRSTFASNIGNHEREGSDQLHDTNFANFLDLFSIVFAAFSGFLSGVNLTGEVRNPGTRGNWALRLGTEA
jgi:amino acid transporter